MYARITCVSAKSEQMTQQMTAAQQKPLGSHVCEVAYLPQEVVPGKSVVVPDLKGQHGNTTHECQVVSFQYEDESLVPFWIKSLFEHTGSSLERTQLDLTKWI